MLNFWLISSGRHSQPRHDLKDPEATARIPDDVHSVRRKDARFTAKGTTVCAFVQGLPEKEAVVKALGLASPEQPGKIQKVELLGYSGTLNWKQEDGALKVEMPADKLSDIGITLKVEMA
jgi:hypothetical protein